MIIIVFFFFIFIHMLLHCVGKMSPAAHLRPMGNILVALTAIFSAANQVLALLFLSAHFMFIYFCEFTQCPPFGSPIIIVQWSSNSSKNNC